MSLNYIGFSFLVSSDIYNNLTIGVKPVPAQIHTSCEQLNNFSNLNEPV